MSKFKFFKKNKENGQGLVEYAIVLPIFLMIVFFIIDYSTVLKDKVAFNMALRESIFDIEFSDNDMFQLKNHLNPFGSPYDEYGRYIEERENRYSWGANPITDENQQRGKDFYMDQTFIDGLTVAEYLKKEIKARDDSIDVDKIEFLNFEGDRESKIGIYSGLQHYHYKKNPAIGGDGLAYAATPKFSTILVAQVRVRYTIEPKGAFMKTIYPDGIPHEKVIYKTSRNFRWRPRVMRPRATDELEGLKNSQGGS